MDCSECLILFRQTEWSLFERHLREVHAPKIPKIYAFTFTTNGNDVDEERTAMRDAVYKLYTQQSCPVSEGEAYLEYTDEGRPHIHGWYKSESGGRVYAKVFKRCWPRWGEKPGQTKFPGGYHEKVKDPKYNQYASAEQRLVLYKKNEEVRFYADVE